MFLIIIVSANNSKHVSEKLIFSEEKKFTKNWVYLGNIFSKSVPPLGGTDLEKYFGQSFQITTPPTPTREGSD